MTTPDDESAETRAQPVYGPYTLVAGAAFAADALSKRWAVQALEGPNGRGSIDVIRGHLDFIVARNDAGAFSMLHGVPAWIRVPFFLLAAAVAIAVLLAVFIRIRHRAQSTARWGLALVLGGAIGNLADRVRDARVIDFIHAHATWNGVEHHWPTFNVADVVIALGAVLLAVDALRKRTPPGTDAHSQTA